MTFSGELGVLIVASAIGLVFALLSLGNIREVYHLFQLAGSDDEVLEAWRHTRFQQWLLVAGWVGFLLTWLVATLNTPPAAPIGATPIGLVIRYLFIGTFVLFSGMTAEAYLYSTSNLRKRRQEQG